MGRAQGSPRLVYPRCRVAELRCSIEHTQDSMLRAYHSACSDPWRLLVRWRATLADVIIETAAIAARATTKMAVINAIPVCPFLFVNAHSPVASSLPISGDKSGRGAVPFNYRLDTQEWIN